MRKIDPITVAIEKDLKPYLTFDSTTLTFYWIDDKAASSLAGRADLTIDISLFNEKADTATF